MKLLKRKKPTLITPEEADRLQKLDVHWQKWSQRMERYVPDRIGMDRHAAIENFIEDPSPENEKILMACCDTKLLATQYRAVREACHTALSKLSYQMRHIVVPILERKIQLLESELAIACEEEATKRAKEKDRGFIYTGHVNDPVSTLKRSISQAEDSIKDLNYLSVTRSPGYYLEILS